MSVLKQLLLVPVYWLLEIVYFLFRCRPRQTITGRHVLITGAAQGIGAAFARQFVAMGNTVHCVDVNTELLEEFVEELKKAGGDVHGYTCDLSNVEEVEELKGKIYATSDKEFVITVLVNNAGIAFGKPLESLTMTQIQAALNVNLVSNLWLIREFLPDMIRLDQGFIINIASMAGLVPLMDSTDYCAAKAGSIATIKQLAAAHGNTNVNFTAVCPWFVNTGMIKGIEAFVNPISPEQVANAGIVAAQEGKQVVAVPRRYLILVWLFKITPLRLFNAQRKAKSVNAKKVISHFRGQEWHKKIN